MDTDKPISSLEVYKDKKVWTINGAFEMRTEDGYNFKFENGEATAVITKVLQSQQE